LGIEQTFVRHQIRIG